MTEEKMKNGSTFKMLQEKIEVCSKLKSEYELGLNAIKEEDIIEDFTYDDRDLLIEARSMASNYHMYNIVSKIDTALKALREKMYPEVTRVKYYKKYLDQLETPLTEEQRLEIDNSLNNLFHPNYVNCRLNTTLSYETKRLVLLELFKMKVIAPLFKISRECDCGGSEDQYLGNIVFGESIYQFFGVPDGDNEGLKEAIENEEIILCDNCCEFLEVRTKSDLEEVMEEYNHPSVFAFKVIAEPDRTLDEL